MDLLNEIGNNDQLISAREENKVLKARVAELTEQVKSLTLTNATLLAEVEIYRKEAALPSFSKIALGEEKGDTEAMDVSQSEYITSGNGRYAASPTVSLPNLHGPCNPLTVSLNSSDTILATGGVDGFLTLTAWGTALAPTKNAISDAISKGAKLRCNAPVICVAFSDLNDIVAAGCMDGSVVLVSYSVNFGKVTARELIVNDGEIKHSKYIKSIAWSPIDSVVTTSSADGTVYISKISTDNFQDDDMQDEESIKYVRIQKAHTLHLAAAPEALCYVKNGSVLCLYERETSYLSYFDLNDECKMTKHSLNGSMTGGFDDHVSFAVMHLCLSPSGKYLVCATDASKNIIMEVGSAKILRNLYGHKNDGFSQPKAVWSSNGQYIYGNTQDDNSIIVWDIASSSIVKKIDKNCDGHTGQVRDIFSSKRSDTLVSASYDKSVKIWLNEMIDQIIGLCHEDVSLF